MDHSHASYRIPDLQWFPEKKFRETLAYLEENRENIEDVCLFSTHTHSVQTVESIASFIPVMTERIRTLQAHGFRTGINVLTTMGHHEENLGHAPKEYVPVTDIYGNVCRGAFCPRHEDFREKLLRPVFTMYAKTGTDYIWIDDDCRYGGHAPVFRICYCDLCMKLFNEQHHTDYTREDLIRATSVGAPEAKLAIRRDLLTFAGESLRGLLKFTADVIHEAVPGMEVGGMDAGGRCGDMCSWADLSDALRQNGSPVRWRPGAGFYNDQTPDQVLEKANSLGCEASRLPDYVTTVCSEQENFNYQRLAKSKHMTAMEACAYQAAGCTGVAWNLMDGSADAMENYGDLMRYVSRVKPFMDRQVRVDGRIRPQGIWNGWSLNYNMSGGLRHDKGNWFHSAGNGVNPHSSKMFAAGLPYAYRLEDASVSILWDDTAWTLSDDEIRQVLSSGLYCDPATLQILNQRGYGEYTGFTVGKSVSEDAGEYLLDHPLNAGCTGFRRECRQSFPWGHEDGYELVSTDGKGIPLAELRDFDEKLLIGCSMGLYENKWGGRICVSGYYGLRDLCFNHKITQVKRLFRYLSHDRLSAYVSSYDRLAIWARLGTENGSAASVNIINCSLDPAEHAQIKVLTAGTDAVLTDLYGAETHVTGTPDGDGYVTFTLPDLKPWYIYLLEILK